jgi:O-antigen ligase
MSLDTAGTSARATQGEKCGLQPSPRRPASRLYSNRQSFISVVPGIRTGGWLGLFFFCLLLLPPLPLPFGNSGVHVAPLVALLGLVAGVVKADEWRTSWRENLPLLFVLFLAILTVSVAFAAVYSGWKIALGSLARVLLFGIGVYIFFYTLIGPRENESDSFRFARFLFWIGLLGATFACIDFYFQLPALARYAPQFVWLKHSVLRRAQGVFYESSTLGNFCAFFLVMILVAAFPPGGQRVFSRFALIPGAVVFSGALILTSSRASMAAVAVAGCVFVWLRRLKIIIVVATCACLSAAALVLRVALPAFSASYWSRLTLSTQYLWSWPNEVLSGRVTHWKTLVHFLAQHPWHLLFGIGYKTIPYTDYIGTRLVADNTYLSLLVETGIVGLTVFAALNVAILRTACRAARSNAGRASFFGTWIFCFWCGEVVQMLSGDSITYWRVLPVYFWVLATAARESGD